MDPDIEKLFDHAGVAAEGGLEALLGRRVTHPAFGAGKIVDIGARGQGQGLIVGVQFGEVGKEFSPDEFRRQFLRKQYVMNQPLISNVEGFVSRVKDAFERKWLTNFGHLHEEFSDALSDELDAPYVLPVTNATFGLLTLLNAMEIRGEVITVPFTFPATYHALFHVAGVTPVFVDVSERNFGMDAEAAAEAITENTAAILPVHVYGFPCDVDRLASLARERNLPLIFDAAPCFGVKYKGTAITNLGDASVLSFHATKVFTTAEGGAIVCRDRELYERCKLFINFGIQGEQTVEMAGLNGKMDELRCALGLANLEGVDLALKRRRRVVEYYLEFFSRSDFPAISYPQDLYQSQDHELNYSYFPVVVEASKEMDRDILYKKLREKGVFARTYYYPTVIDSPIYEDYHPQYAELPVAEKLSKNVLCLPVNPNFDETDCEYIVEALADSMGSA